MNKTIEDNIFLYKLCDKKDKFPFFVVRMPYISSNIPLWIFYGLIISEFLQIARCTHILTDFVPKASQLYARIITQGGNKASILPQMKNTFQRYPDTFSKYCKRYN